MCKASQIIKAPLYDKPAGLGVVIAKMGNLDALAGKQTRNDFADANSSEANN